ncbi:MAG: ABC transporter permease [Gemmatimonadales bacterium]|nr:ABC transporter permease [Gemmatimonadales bacterium]MBA3553683.1 ABC transporter permease [Gemmatimonadales bacterium]
MSDALRRDLRLAFRGLRQRPGFTAVTVLTLGLGIGAVTAIFSAVNWVLLRPLPYATAERVVWAWGQFPGGDRAAVSTPDFHDYRTAAGSFGHFAAFMPTALNLSGGEGPERVVGALASADFFEVFGTPALAGRTFGPDAARVAGAAETAVVSRALARRRLGGERSAIGRTVLVNGRPLTVIGVVPETFRLPADADVWLPSSFEGEGSDERRVRPLRVVGLLRTGVSVREAQAELDLIAARLALAHPESNTGWSLRLEPLKQALVGDLRRPLWVLFGAVGFVLLIACVNLANLQLARAMGRQRETAVRLALGADRWQLVRHALSEVIILAALGGGVGLLLAVWGVELLGALVPRDLPQMAEMRLDVRVLGFAAGISILTGLIAGLTPVLASGRPGAMLEVATGGRAPTVGAGRRRARGALVVAEMALALILLAGAGLLLKSFARLQQVDPGFEAGQALAARVDLPRSRYPDEASRTRFFSELISGLGAAPGIRAAGATTHLPLSGQQNDNFFSIEGRPWPEPNAQIGANLRAVTPGYFDALSMTLLGGRRFEEREATAGAGVVIVNDAFARTWFPGESPLGRRLLVELDGARAYEVVGVVSDVRHFGLRDDAPPEMYLPLYSMWGGGNLVVRTTAADPMAAADVVREHVRRLDPDQPVAALRPLNELVSDSIAPARLQTTLLALFAAVAVALACLGLYGVMAGAVAERTREIGVRVALGAQRGDVMGLVLRRATFLAGAGVVVGLAGALLLSRFLETLLFQVAPADPAVLAGVASCLAAVALASSWVPARRAARVDPLVALRSE